MTLEDLIRHSIVDERIVRPREVHKNVTDFLSTLFGIIITYGIRWSMNEDKILAEMKENLKNPKKAKPGKKASGWVARLQEIQREQERQMKKQREEQQRKLRR